VFGGGSEPFNLDQSTIPPCSAKLRGMTDDLDTLHARLDKLAALVELAQLNQAKDHVRIERSIQLVCCALQEIARFWRQTGNQTCQSEAAEIMALCRRIVEDARRAGVRMAITTTAIARFPYQGFCSPISAPQVFPQMGSSLPCRVNSVGWNTDNLDPLIHC
jgi:hypothetical protein